jgi:hypothetical protein
MNYGQLLTRSFGYIVLEPCHRHCVLFRGQEDRPPPAISLGYGWYDSYFCCMDGSQRQLCTDGKLRCGEGSRSHDLHLLLLLYDYASIDVYIYITEIFPFVHQAKGVPLTQVFACGGSAFVKFVNPWGDEADG